jgi:outer membrane protein assembly factor BamB
MGDKDNEEYLRALDVKDGKLLWSLKVGRVGKNEGPQYPGARSTPTVEAEAVYTLGSDGDLVCADPTEGKLLWHKQLRQDFDGKPGAWAYTESLLIDGDVLICTPGGPTATMLALNKKTGDVIWKMAMEDANRAGYASAIIAQVGDVKQYVQFLGSGVIGVSAQEGRLLWRYRKNVGGISATTPIFHDGCIFTSASGTEGSGGDALLRLIPDGQGGVDAKQIYLVRTITNHHGGVVRVGDYLYGSSGNALVCMDFKTGEVKWQERSARGSLVVADGHLYVRGEQGTVVLAEATPAGYKEKGRFRQPFRSRLATFPHPVVANGRLYLRDDDVLLCYDIQASSEK